MLAAASPWSEISPIDWIIDFPRDSMIVSIDRQNLRVRELSLIDSPNQAAATSLAAAMRNSDLQWTTAA